MRRGNRVSPQLVLRSCVLSLLSITSVGCSDPDEGLPRVPEPDGKPVLIQATVLQEGSFLRRPRSIAVLGSRLVVLDAGAELHVLRTADGALLASARREGDGSGELRSPSALEPDLQDGNSLWVYDQAHARSTRLTLTGTDRPSLDHSGTLAFKSDAPLLHPAWLDDSTMVGHGLFEDGRLAVFDRNGAKVRTLGDLPPEPEDRPVPAQVRQHAYTGTLTASSRRGRVAMATRHADELTIYSKDGTVVRQVRGSHGYEPKYQARRMKGVPYMTTGDDLRFGYIDLVSTDSLIYGLFSGRSRAEAPGRANYGRFVQVFDWDGSLRRTYQLDFEAIAMTVDRSGSHLLAIRHHPSPAVLRLPLLHGSVRPTAESAAVRD